MCFVYNIGLEYAFFLLFFQDTSIAVFVYSLAEQQLTACASVGSCSFILNERSRIMRPIDVLLLLLSSTAVSCLIYF